MKLNVIKLLFFSVVMLICMMPEKVKLINASDYIELDDYDDLQNIVYQKLNTTDFNVELIDSFNTPNRYFLVEGDNCYLIYDRILHDYMEFSHTSNSIFNQINFRKIYLGTGYYFTENDSIITDLITGAILDEDKLENYIAIEENFINTFNYNKNIQENDQNVAINSSRTSDYPTSKYINNRVYFDNLHGNIGTNTNTHYNGSCGFVALEMILSYYDSFLNDNIIGESYDVEVTKTFSDYNNINLSSYPESPGINDMFHSYFIQLGKTNNYTSNGSNSLFINDHDELIKDYFEIIALSVTTDETALFENKINFCKTAINYNLPVLISINGIDTSINPDNLNHSVVGYGYDETGIYVHFGWKYNSQINVNINNYSINYALYFVVNEEHTCSDNYKWELNGCTGTICPCGIKICNHESLSYECSSATTHISSCNACSYSYVEDHSNIDYESVNSNYHKVICSYCFDYDLEEHNFTITDEYKICSQCGYYEEICQHENWSYELSTSDNHKMTCINCGYFEYNPHTNYFYEQVNNIQHKVTCVDCNYYFYEGHDFETASNTKTCVNCDYQEIICNHENITYEHVSDIEHKVKCNDCDYYYLEEHDIYVTEHTQYCSKCDYENVLSAGHNYIYIPLSGGKNHKKQCSICGTFTIEACIALGQAGTNDRSCALCGQEMNSSGGILAPLKKEDEEEI